MKAQIAVCFVLLSAMSGCSPEGSSKSKDQSAQAQDPKIGNSYFATANIDSGTKRVVILRFVHPNRYEFLSGDFKTSSGFLTYRKEDGTFSSSGTTYNVNVSSSTCPGDLQATFEITGDPEDSIYVKDLKTATTTRLFNDKKYYVVGLDSTSVRGGQEDTGCDKLAKSSTPIEQKRMSRLPASKDRFVESVLSSIK